MNIIEALKSRKRVRRLCWLDKHLWSDTKNLLFTPGDVLADDWEIEEKKIEITESELNEIFDKVEGSSDGTYRLYANMIFKEIKRNLGL